MASSVPFYPSHWWVETSILGCAERGALISLCAWCWHHGKSKVKDDPKHISRVLGCTAGRWRKMRAALLDAGFLAQSEGELCVKILGRWESFSARRAIPADIRRGVVERDMGRCVYCGVDAGQNFHLDHIIPRSRGGSDDLENLALSCAPCNLSKGARTPDEWQQ